MNRHELARISERLSQLAAKYEGETAGVRELIDIVKEWVLSLQYDADIDYMYKIDY